MEDRRGFLKTLGKLAAAVGITTAVATVPAKAKIDTTLKTTRLPHHSNIGIRTVGISSAGLPIQETYSKNNSMADAQAAIDTLTNLQVDNLRMEMNPPMFIPAHIRDFVMKKEAIRSLDPYNWGAVFDLKWVDWNQPTNFATSIGRWEARVKPQFRGVVGGEVYTQSKEIAVDYLRSSVANADILLKYAKEQCYRELIDSLQDVILERIKRDVKANGVEMRHISNRDEFFAKNPDTAKRITE